MNDYEAMLRYIDECFKAKDLENLKCIIDNDDTGFFAAIAKTAYNFGIRDNLSDFMHCLFCEMLNSEYVMSIIDERFKQEVENENLRSPR